MGAVSTISTQPVLLGDAPSSAIEEKFDETSGASYYFDNSTGKSAWTLAELTGGAYGGRGSSLAVTNLNDLSTAYGTGKKKPRKSCLAQVCGGCSSRKENSGAGEAEAEFSLNNPKSRSACCRYCRSDQPRRHSDKDGGEEERQFRGVAGFLCKCFCPPCTVYHDKGCCVCPDMFCAWCCCCWFTLLWYVPSKRLASSQGAVRRLFLPCFSTHPLGHVLTPHNWSLP